jgi:hypothetical protein
MATAGAGTGLLKAAAAAIAAGAAKQPIAATLPAAEEHVAAVMVCAAAARRLAAVVHLGATEQPVKARDDPRHPGRQVTQRPPARAAVVVDMLVAAAQGPGPVDMPVVVVVDTQAADMLAVDMPAANTSNHSRSGKMQKRPSIPAPPLSRLSKQ